MKRVYDFLKNYIAGLQEDAKHATDVVKALQILENRKRILEQQKKKQRGEIHEQRAKLDAGLELMEKEISDCLKQLELLEKQKMQIVIEVCAAILKIAVPPLAVILILFIIADR